MAAAAMALGLVTWVSAHWPSDSTPRLKGPPTVTLELFASRLGAPATALAPGQRLHAGDVLRFAVTTPRDGYLTIFDLDSRGHVTQYYPPPSQPAAPITGHARTLLPGSIELDDDPNDERLVLVFATHPFDAAQVEPALAGAFARAGLAGLDALEVPDALVATVPVQKGPP